MAFGLGVVFLFGRIAREIAAASVIVATASTNVLKGTMRPCSAIAPRMACINSSRQEWHHAYGLGSRKWRRGVRAAGAPGCATVPA
jgi:hypothetical protein